MNTTKIFFSLCAAMTITLSNPANARTIAVDMTRYGVVPEKNKSLTATFNEAIKKARKLQQPGDTLLLQLKPGTYRFAPHKTMRRTLFISNHDQDNPKNVGLELTQCSNLIIDGAGADLRFDGRMLPVVVSDATNCTLRNFSIDFDNPQIAQVTILENDTLNNIITYKPAPYVSYRIDSAGRFINHGNGWEMQPIAGIAFDATTRHILYNTSDISVGTNNVEQLPDGSLRAPWNNHKLHEGNIVAMRSYARPCPAIFVDDCKNISFNNVAVHYAEGMGLLAQNTCNITLDRFCVALRSKDDTRYFTTQADATHFSGCSGKIISTGGTYEGMMDDAINVHGTYLKAIRRIDERTFEASYMHPQSYGFRWALPGDSISVISTPTMDIACGELTIKSIQPIDAATDSGAKIFRIEFNETVNDAIDPADGSFGLENLSTTPEVVFSNNTIRNNRARGALFSTPRPVLVENNIFDHTSGSAILLCGDCNGWYETGACRSVTISGNHFINALTNMFQFTNAVISIYPEIPDLNSQRGYFHSGIRITGNLFETFDTPLVYAKSVDGIWFIGNTVKRNNDFTPLFTNGSQIFLERTTNAHIDPAMELQQ